jgi:hypothetical protein
MSVKKWVQHISGQGEKWEVRDCAYNLMEPPNDDICVINPNPGKGISRYHFLPKSEYILCDPPKEWEDVTSEVEKSITPGNYRCGHIDIIGMVGAGEDYRLTKMLLEHGPTATQKWAFIVERRKS